MRYLTLAPRAESSILSGHDPLSFDTTQPQRIFVIQAIIIIVFSRVLGWGLAKIRQPSVIAEVIGGILLGPTVMGRIPGFSDNIFPKPTLPFLNLVATVGLILFLFLVGLEVDLRVIKRCAVQSVAISLTGLIVPFALGVALAVGLYKEFVDTTRVNEGHFFLFVGVAMAITAFPVLARILTELKLLDTRAGLVVLAAGVGNDIVGWVLLAVAVALVNAGSGLVGLYILLVAAGWALVLFLVIKPVFYWFCRRTGSLSGQGPSQLMMCIVIVLVFASAFLTDVIGVHPIFGSFLVGLIIPHEGGFAVALTEKIEDIIAVVFLPLYFALSGLNTNLGTLDSGIVWGYTIAIILVAFFSKFLSCAAAARLAGFNLREAGAVGSLMSCKGLVELIVLNVGLQAGILNTRIFSMFVVMALVTTFVTTPLTIWIYPESARTTAKEGSIFGRRTEADDESSDEKSPRGGALSGASKRLLVVLDRFEHLPGLLTLVQLMRPTQPAAFTAAESQSTVAGAARRRHVAGSSDDGSIAKEDLSEDGSPTTHVLNSSAPGPQTVRSNDLTIDALRLVELSERTSAVMRVAEQEETQRADPLINVFRTVSHLNHLSVESSMAVVPSEDFLPTVASAARRAESDLVIVPWTIPPVALGVQPEVSQGVFTALASPFDSLFGSYGANEASAKHASPQYANFVRSLFQSAPCDVGLLVDRPKEAMTALPPMGMRPQLLLAFMGGPDDRVALELVKRLCATNTTLRATVLRFQRLAPEDSGDAPLPNMPPTIHHNQSIQHQDTMYPTQQGRGGAGAGSLEASLEDDLAIKAAEEDGRCAGRLDVKLVSTSRPLRDLIASVESEQPTIVIVGRGRRQPAMTHREELRYLLKYGNVSPDQVNVDAASPTTATGLTNAGEGSGSAAAEVVDAKDAGERALRSETCKVIGEPAMAVTRFAQTGACTLVIAAGLGRSSRLGA